MVKFRSVIIGILTLTAVLIVGPFVANKFHYALPHFNIGLFRYIGIIAIIAGLPLILWSSYLIIFASKEIRAIPYESEDDFTPSGPYKYIRNPFMLGCLLALWGEVIFFECSAMAVYAAIVTWCIIFWVRCCEEPSLEERYGEEYLSYKRKIPRWFLKRHK